MPAEASVTLASLNMHGGVDRAGVPFDLGEACRTLDADIVVLQETWRADSRDPVAAASSALGLAAVRHDSLPGTSLHRLGIPGADQHAAGVWGLAVLTRLPVVEERTVELGLARGDIVGRAAQVVTVALPAGGALRVVNTHLTHRFLASPAQLRRLVRVLLAGRHPTAIVGDLNTFFPLTLAASGYRRAVRGATWPAHRPLLQLDHLLIDRRLRAAHGTVTGPLGSDHLAIRAGLDVAGS